MSHERCTHDVDGGLVVNIPCEGPRLKSRDDGGAFSGQTATRSGGAVVLPNHVTSITKMIADSVKETCTTYIYINEI